MMPWFLHPHRADVLAACALVARSRSPLADGLERLAAEDPLLTRWSRRLGPPLRAGEDVPETLRRARLLDAEEAELLAHSEDLAEGLERAASSIQTGPWRMRLVRHLPLSLAIALGAPSIVVSSVLALSGLTSSSVAGLGILTPANARPERLLFTWFLLLQVAIAAEHLLRSVRGLRHLATLWCPGVERERALLRLLRAARTGRAPKPRLGALRLALSLVGLAAQPLSLPAWNSDWRTWKVLTYLRLPRRTWLDAGREGDLAARLVLVGAVETIDGRPDWAGAEDRCRARLAEGIDDAMLIARPLLLLAVWVSAVAALSGLWLGLIRELGRMT
jgi:hypothetical protein